MGEFHRAAGTTDIPPGSGRSVEVDGRLVALFNVEGTFHAMDGCCPHRNAPLGEGQLDGNVVICPWHAWPFDVTNGTFTENDELKLSCFPVKVEGEDVLVELPERTL